MSENTQQPVSKKPAFTILGTIGYETQEQLDTFISSMDQKGGIFVLIQAAQYAQARGLFNLTEASVVATAVKKFLTVPAEDAQQTFTNP